MVHHTIKTSIPPASKASSKINSMFLFPWSRQTAILGARLCGLRWHFVWRWTLPALLAACASKLAPLPEAVPTVPIAKPSPAPVTSPATLPTVIATAPDTVPAASRRSQLVPVAWSDLPGWDNESMPEVWSVLLSNCERPGNLMAAVCPDVRRLTLASDAEQKQWLMQRLQPHRIENTQGEASGLLTGYFEPVLEARRIPGNGFSVPVYRPPAGLKSGQPWFTRQEIDSQQTAQSALHGREIAWLADPVDAMVLHIQGSGRLRITEGDGRVRMVRVGFAGSNEQPYQSIGRWLLDNNEVKDASWPGIKAWLQRNPTKVQALLWVNPRYVFFKEEAIPDAAIGPRGAQGLPLTPGRSIAVDPQSLDYGTPVWMVSPGPTQALQRLVVAQDTGSAIVGAVRADLYMGTGAAAGELAGRMKQPLRLWALLPKTP
jgi:membrane-bound lytic murein transglycosylase A